MSSSEKKVSDDMAVPKTAKKKKKNAEKKKSKLIDQTLHWVQEKLQEETGEDEFKEAVKQG